MATQDDDTLLDDALVEQRANQEGPSRLVEQRANQGGPSSGVSIRRVKHILARSDINDMVMQQ